MADNKVMRALEAQVHPTRMTRANFSTVPPLLARRSPYLTFPGRPRTDTTDATTQVDSTHRRGPPPGRLGHGFGQSGRPNDLALVSHEESFRSPLAPITPLRQPRPASASPPPPSPTSPRPRPRSPPGTGFPPHLCLLHRLWRPHSSARRADRPPEGLREAFLHGPEYRISALRKRKTAEITETNIFLDNTRECPTSRCESDARH